MQTGIDVATVGLKVIRGEDLTFFDFVTLVGAGLTVAGALRGSGCFVAGTLVTMTPGHPGQLQIAHSPSSLASLFIVGGVAGLIVYGTAKLGEKKKNRQQYAIPARLFRRRVIDPASALADELVNFLTPETLNRFQLIAAGLPVSLPVAEPTPVTAENQPAPPEPDRTERANPEPVEENPTATTTSNLPVAAIATKPRESKSWLSWIGNAGLFFGLLLLTFGVGGWLINANSLPDNAVNVSPVGTAAWHKPIEQIVPGERVIGENPIEAEDSTFGPVDPATWKQITLRAQKETGGYCDIEMLRPDWWFEASGAEVNSRLWLEMDELGVRGYALVLGIEAGPPIPTGEGHVVTATFHHSASTVYEVAIADNEAIGVTGNHPFYSADRKEFVPAAQLKTGENVLTLDGPRPVESIATLPGEHRVFNLEIHGQHVYHVGSSGTLVHNKCAKGGTYKLEDANGKVVRTGRSKNLHSRMLAHARDPATKDLKFKVDKYTDSYAAQRGREQIIHDAHPEAKIENGGLNKVRGISPKNPNIDTYMRAGRALK